MDDGEQQLHFAFLSQALDEFSLSSTSERFQCRWVVYMDGVMALWWMYVFVTCVFLLFHLTVECTLSEWRNPIAKSLYIHFYVGFHLDVEGKEKSKVKITLQLWFDK